MLLEKPFNEVLASGKPDFPFCLGWANHSWIGKGFGAGGRLLKKQAYPGINDHKQHFDWWLQAFRDPRYITVDGKPLLFIYRPKDIPNIKSVTVYWRSLAQEAGLPGLHLVGETLTEHNYKQYGFDAHSSFNLFAIEKNPSKFWGKLFQYRRWLGLPNIHRYSQAEQYWVSPSQHQYPYLIPNWDTTPRYGRYAEILLGSSPEKFRKHVRSVIQAVKDRPPQQRIVFLKSWNEWAEGNYIEPDAKWGRAYLEVLRDELFKNH